MTEIMNFSFLAFPEKGRYRCISLDGQFDKLLPARFFGKSSEQGSVFCHESNQHRELHKLENRTLTMLLTTSCNQKCIMCPQCLNNDPVNADELLDLFIANFPFARVDSLYVTGGEPFLKSSAIDVLIEKVPKNVNIVILTNGTIRPSERLLSLPNVTLCIPLYASFDTLHNRLTGSSGFYKTLDNLLYFSSFYVPLELRFVITKQNYRNIPEFSVFIQKNLPFVARIAFMGIELMESASRNSELLWIDPPVYIPILEDAIDYLVDFRLPVVIYNLQPCLFRQKYRGYVKQTISDWKRAYAPCCACCELKVDCGGFFRSDYDRYISLLTEPIL